MAALAASSVTASATVQSLGVAWYLDTVQTGDGVATEPPVGYFGATLSGTDVGDLVAARITNPLGAALDFYDASYGEGTFMMAFSGPHPSLADLLAAYPGGSHTVDLTAGAAAPDSATFVVDPPDVPDTEPHLDGGTFSAMQAWTSGTDAPLTWPAFATSGAAEVEGTDFYLFDYTSNQLIHTDYLGSESTGTTVSGFDMLSGHAYGFQLDFWSGFSYYGVGFDRARADATFRRRASGLLRCKADPGTVAGRLTLGDYQPDAAGELVTVQVVAGDGTVEDTQDVVVGAYGWYAFDTLATGVKTIKFKGRHWLTRAVPDVDLDAGADQVDPTLANGDIDDDDAVTVFDYDRLSAAFDTSAGDPAWDASADLDGDGTVSVFDYDILSRNFDQVGD